MGFKNDFKISPQRQQGGVLTNGQIRRMEAQVNSWKKLQRCRNLYPAAIRQQDVVVSSLSSSAEVALRRFQLSKRIEKRHFDGLSGSKCYRLLDRDGRRRAESDCICLASNSGSSAFCNASFPRGTWSTR